MNGATSRADDSADSGRLNAGWVAVNSTAEGINQGYRDKARARARDLERNSDIAEAIIGAFERNVVGTGIQLQAKVLLADGETENDELNQKIEDLWADWCRARNCDITGQSSFFELQSMAERLLRVDGGMLFIKVFKDGKFQLQAQEVIDLDNSMCSIVAPNRIASSMELG